MTHIEHQTDMLAQLFKKIFTIISTKLHFIFCSFDKQKTYTIDFKNKYYIRLLTEMLGVCDSKILGHPDFFFT